MNMRVCDWIANFVYDQGIRHIHGLTGVIVTGKQIGRAHV